MPKHTNGGREIHIQEDLYGCSRKEVIDTKTGEKSTYWKDNPNQPGEYPHHTQDKHGNWHHSTDARGKGNHTSVGEQSTPDVSSETASDESSFNLFDPGTWF